MKRSLTYLFLAVLMTSLSLTPATASALTDDEKAELQKVISEGSEAYKSGRFLDAVDAFERAEEISPDPRIQYNLGRALESAGECQRALARFGKLAENSDAEKVVRERAKEKVDGGVDCIPMGTVTFTCETPEAAITFDGESVECGGTVRTKIEEKGWKATKPGFMPARGKVTAVETQTVTVVVGLAPPPVPESPWKLFAGGGLVAAGVGLLAIGVVSDATSNTRSEQIIDASADGDRDRLALLQQNSDSAQTRTLILYSSGTALAIGGGILLWLHQSEDDGGGVAIAPGLAPDGASVTARWQW